MIELVEKRQENSKRFRVDSKTRQLRVSMGAVHYKDDYASNEQWKDIDLTWEGNRITKAPYELTLDGKKITIKDKKSGEISSIELLGSKPIESQWEIVPEHTRVNFRHNLSSDEVPFEAAFKIVGKIPFLRTRAFDDEGELELETSIVGGILTEKLTSVKDKITGQVRLAKGEIKVDPTWQVGESSDDCWMRIAANPLFSLTGDFVAGYANAAQVDLSCAARFVDVGISAEATIISAELILTCQTKFSTTTVNTRIRCERSAAPATFSDQTDFDTRTWTTEKVNWDAIPIWEVDTEYTSPDFKVPLQEVITNHGALTNIAVFWDDLERRSTAATETMRYANAYDDSTSKAPQLAVTYTAPATRGWMSK